jgi:hypothetical protein
MDNALEIGLPTEDYRRRLYELIARSYYSAWKARASKEPLGWMPVLRGPVGPLVLRHGDIKVTNFVPCSTEEDLFPSLDLERPTAEERLEQVEHENAALRATVRFLEAQLGTDRPYAQLYKLGAGSLFVAVISLVFWGLTGIGAPFHPIFAAAALPASVGIIAMAFLVRGEKSQKSTRDASTTG